MAWGIGLLHRTEKKKPKAMVSILSIVAVALVVFAYLITMNYLEDIGFIHRQSQFYYGQLEVFRFVSWGLVSTGIGIFIYKDSL